MTATNPSAATIEITDEAKYRFEAVAALRGITLRELMEQTAREIGDAAGIKLPDEVPSNFYQKHPLPPSLAGSLTDDLREAFADVDAGRVVSGEIILAEIRQRALGTYEAGRK